MLTRNFPGLYGDFLSKTGHCPAQCSIQMDPWWQSAIERQAIDRVNRIGRASSFLLRDERLSGQAEKKMVKVFKVIAEGTVGEIRATARTSIQHLL